MSGIERELEHTSDLDLDEEAALATPDEQMENMIQMERLYRMTIEEGVMRLPVKHNGVASTPDRGVWSITVEHPVEGDLEMFVDKPKHGWHPDHELAELLRWYEIHDNDVYKLQERHLVMEHDPEKADRNHGWRIVKPPSYTEPEKPVMEQLREYSQWRPSRAAQTMYGFLTVGAVTGALIAAIVPGVIIPVALALLLFVGWTILGMAVTEP